MRQQRGIQDFLDRWYPTIIHYTGIAVVIYAFAIDRFRNPGLLPLGGGLALFPTPRRGGDS